MRAALLLSLLFITSGGQAQAQASPTAAEPARLLAVLRPSWGNPQPSPALRPVAVQPVELDDGRAVPIEASWYDYLGDLQVRLVFDDRQGLASASRADLARWRLDAQGALDAAFANLRRLYGEPQATPWTGGLYQVHGRADDLHSSYFLDRAFWMDQEARHPGGLVVAVPHRGALVFAPARDEEAVAQLRFGVAALYAAGRRTKVSAALYRFQDGQWSVHEAPAVAAAH